MQSCALKVGLVAALASVLAGCGGSGPKTTETGTVAQVTLTPSSISVVSGEVLQLSFSAVNSTGSAVSPTPTFTFHSSDTSVATVSPSGLVCGGIWDSFFVVCNASDSHGNPIVGTALITASAGGVSSAPSQATVHQSVTSITISQTSGNVLPACNSIPQTSQLQAKVFHNATDITTQVGPVNWSSSAASVASIDANGVATARAPGLTSVVASVGTVSSPFFSLKTCMPIQITLHINGDAAGQPTESATMNVTDTRTIEADMVDEQGITTNSAPVSILSNNTEVAALTGTTLTAESPGGAGLIAACIPPSCGAGLNTIVYSNVFSVLVNSSSPVTTIYATSSFTPPSGTTPTIVPIDTSKTPIVAGTALNLPGTPNSLVFNAAGSKGYMGTSAGIAVLDTAANTVTAVDPFIGKVLAVSPDGNTVILSNAANDPSTVTPIETDLPSQRLVILSAANNTVQSFVLPGAIAASFTGDSSRAYVVVNDGNPADNGNVYVFSNFETLHTVALTLSPGAVGNSVATVAGSAYALFATNSGLQVMATCNNAQQPIANNPSTNSQALQLVSAILNSNIVVAVDATGVDIETATINSILSTNPPLPFTLTPADCAPPVSFSNQFVDFGLGPFTARQLLTPTNGVGGNNGSHVVVLPAGMNSLLVSVPGGGGETIPLAGSGTEPVSGGMTLDGNTVWVGVAGSNDVHQIALTSDPSKADILQIPMSFKKSDGSAAPPNIVVVKPH
ncbi:MAG TPA: hypothetical protein VKW06_01615 [Candidatus Angelobacter sp.]|nr:hypothetical protein [Candidatus Angelobacter sp.]